MAETFYFYDLETSGVNPRAARVMQFAGQRTDLEMTPIGEPTNLLIKLSEDVLPDPEAILITGITPQQTHTEGLTEAKFLEHFYAEIATTGTIIVGFNTVRFDDEFMRFMNYRNYYDAYEWQWKNGRSRWDLLDLVRMTRALRPEGIKWPVDSSGTPSNRLELLTSINKLDHTNAHDALSDVQASIELGRLLRQKQPKLFDFLLGMRHKNNVANMVNIGEPFVYSSGKYPNEFEKTTVAVKLANHPKKTGALVYDLRHDPMPFAKMSPEALADSWKWKKDSDESRLPIKTLQFNRCPAIAPLGVLDNASQKRLKIDLPLIEQNLSKLKAIDEWPASVLKALDILDSVQQAQFFGDSNTVDEQLYEGFINDHDKEQMNQLRQTSPEKLSSFVEKFSDPRLSALLPLYKARNFPGCLSDEERQTWENFKTHKLLDGGKTSGLARYFARIEELSSQAHLTQKQKNLLEDLKLYGQSLLPSD